METNLTQEPISARTRIVMVITDKYLEPIRKMTKRPWRLKLSSGEYTFLEESSVYQDLA
jgi:hypothetical protein